MDREEDSGRLIFHGYDTGGTETRPGMKTIYRIREKDGGLKEVSPEVFYDYISSNGFEGTLDDVLTYAAVSEFIANFKEEEAHD